jgi:hypothetical protein
MEIELVATDQLKRCFVDVSSVSAPKAQLCAWNLRGMRRENTVEETGRFLAAVGIQLTKGFDYTCFCLRLCGGGVHA